MWRSRRRCVIKPAYSVSFLLSINRFVWQNVLYFLDAPRTTQSVKTSTWKSPHYVAAPYTSMTYRCYRGWPKINLAAGGCRRAIYNNADVLKKASGFTFPIQSHKCYSEFCQIKRITCHLLQTYRNFYHRQRQRIRNVKLCWCGSVYRANISKLLYNHS